jgi:hypothetical protein
MEPRLLLFRARPLLLFVVGALRRRDLAREGVGDDPEQLELAEQLLVQTPRDQRHRVFQRLDLWDVLVAVKLLHEEQHAVQLARVLRVLGAAQPRSALWLRAHKARAHIAQEHMASASQQAQV